MKKTINKLVLLCVISFSVSLINPLAGQTNSGSTTCMEITGKVLHLSGKTGNTYKVELLCNNLVLDSLRVQNHKAFKFSIPKNCFYAIRISKQGYITRLISVYSQLFPDDSGLYRFEFDTELIEEKHSSELDTEAMDFPIAIISYDRDMRAFYYNEEYTANIKRSLYSGNKSVKSPKSVVVSEQQVNSNIKDKNLTPVGKWE